MTRLFRSKSCALPEFNADQEEEEEEEISEDEDGALYNPITTPYDSEAQHYNAENNINNNNNQFAIMDILVTALRKSIVTCSVVRDDVSSTSSSTSSLDISWPTEVRHVSHVTFDRFNGFLGLPTELEPQLPSKVPSASVRVFGVSAQSMQCAYDDRGNSVPTILLTMQKRLYSGGGLQAEGIFRINAENSQEESVRDRLNKGIVPHGIDIHCLAGLIKAWFRELPAGVLDSLTPEQVMRCNTEDDCTELVKLLPPTEASLLDWSVNLMADVVRHEDCNKMNARNIAMVFAPNMTQMADPLTALIHAVQVMNFLKTLILKKLRERDESFTKITNKPSSSDTEQNSDAREEARKPRTAALDSLEPKIDEKLWRSHGEEERLIGAKSRLADHFRRTASEHRYDGIMAESECGPGPGEEFEGGDWLSLRKGVRKLCRHPVFQLNKPSKKTPTLGIVDTDTRERPEAWA